MTEGNFVEVYRAKHGAQAMLLQQVLEDEGIPTRVEGALLDGAAGELPLGWATSPRLLVEEQNVERARAFLEKADQSEMAEMEAEEAGVTDEETARCLSCGADMPEDVEKCPACGWSYAQGGEPEG